jgi:hypothetical protein
MVFNHTALFDFDTLTTKLDPTQWTGSTLTSVQYAGVVALAMAYFGYNFLWVIAPSLLVLAAKQRSPMLVAAVVAAGYGKRFGPKWMFYAGLFVAYTTLYGVKILGT